jgi:hypothetical protein
VSGITEWWVGVDLCERDDIDSDLPVIIGLIPEPDPKALKPAQAHYAERAEKQLIRAIAPRKR